MAAVLGGVFYLLKLPLYANLYLPVLIAGSFVQGFNGWDRWGHMALRYTLWSAPIAIVWAITVASPWPLFYGLAGLSGLVYPWLNRTQPTPWLFYTQWAEIATGVAMIDAAILIAWLT